MTAQPIEPQCDSDYESHAWDWIDGDHICPDCGLIDLDGRRLLAEVAYRLELPRATVKHLTRARPEQQPAPAR